MKILIKYTIIKPITTLYILTLIKYKYLSVLKSTAITMINFCMCKV